MLALLALSCPPALAGADSSGIQYEDAPPTVSGGKAKQDREQSAGASGAEGGGSSAGGAAGGGGSGSSGSGSGGGSPSGSGSGGAGAAGQGSSGAGSPGSVGGAQALEAGQPASSGGSSPLTPILIAIAVLAAISLGALLIRHRRRTATDSPGSSVYPEAG